MAGLQLGFNAGLFTPAAALPPSMAGTAEGATISSRAYGLRDTGSSRQTAGLGSAAVGTACAVLLVALWWALPR